jgi:hypothetical protein
MKIIFIERTCYLCPSQWEGILSDGQNIYIRYRWGIFTVGIGNNLSTAFGNYYYSRDIGGCYDGYMSNRDMFKILKKIPIRVSFLVWLLFHLPRF